MFFPSLKTFSIGFCSSTFFVVFVSLLVISNKYDHVKGNIISIDSEEECQINYIFNINNIEYSGQDTVDHDLCTHYIESNEIIDICYCKDNPHENKHGCLQINGLVQIFMIVASCALAFGIVLFFPASIMHDRDKYYENIRAKRMVVFSMKEKEKEKKIEEMLVFEMKKRKKREKKENEEKKINEEKGK